MFISVKTICVYLYEYWVGLYPCVIQLKVGSINIENILLTKNPFLYSLFSYILYQTIKKVGGSINIENIDIELLFALFIFLYSLLNYEKGLDWPIFKILTKNYILHFTTSLVVFPLGSRCSLQNKGWSSCSLQNKGFNIHIIISSSTNHHCVNCLLYLSVDTANPNPNANKLSWAINHQPPSM